MQKGHRKSTKGAKANKKKRKEQLQNSKEVRNNPKAFGVAKRGRARKQIQRNLDSAHQKEYVPLANRVEEVPPPISVVVMGPPGSGKSSLIRVRAPILLVFLSCLIFLSLVSCETIHASEYWRNQRTNYCCEQ